MRYIFKNGLGFGAFRAALEAEGIRTSDIKVDVAWSKDDQPMTITIGDRPADEAARVLQLAMQHGGGIA